MNTSVISYATLFSFLTLTLTWAIVKHKKRWAAPIVAVTSVITGIFGVIHLAVGGHVAGAATLFAIAAIGAVAFLVSTSSKKRRAKEGEDIAGLRSYEATTPRYTFDDVIGMDSLKKQLLKDLEKVTSEGKNGFLFHGKPGTGKTFIAEAFAGEIARRYGKKGAIKFMPVN